MTSHKFDYILKLASYQKCLVMRQLILLLAVIGCSLAIFGIGRKQSVAVRGRLFCGGLPVAGVKVKLYKRGKLMDAKLNEVTTDGNGNFLVSGSAAAITNIEPKIKILHKCNYSGRCFRRTSVKIPKSQVSRGKVPNKVHDVGLINLMNKFPGEKKEC